MDKCQNINNQDNEMDIEQQRLHKTQNIKLYDKWVYDCTFSKVVLANKPQSRRSTLSEKNGINHNNSINKKEQNLQQLSKYTILACTKLGRLMSVEKCANGSFQNEEVIYQSSQLEDFYRIYEDYDSLDYFSRYTLISGSRKRIHVFKLNDNDNLKQSLKKVHEYIPTPDRNVYGMSGYKKHSQKLFSSGAFNVTLYDIEHQKIVRRIKNRVENACVEYIRDLNIFATCGIAYDIIIYDDRQYKHIFSLKQHTQNIVRLAKIDNNNQFFLASGSHDHSLVLWDIRYMKNSQVFKNHHQDAIFGLSYDSDKQIIYSSSWDSSVKAVDLSTLQVIGHIKNAQTDKIISCKYSPESGEIMTSSRDGSIQFYSIS